VPAILGLVILALVIILFALVRDKVRSRGRVEEVEE